MRKNIESLINSGITAHQVANATGIPRNTAYRIFSGEANIDNITLKNAEILNKYWEELDMIIIKKVKNHEGIIGKEFEETYLDLKQGEKRLNEVISDALEGTDIEDLMEYEQEEYRDVENLVSGEYSLNQGDFTYYITIK